MKILKRDNGIGNVSSMFCVMMNFPTSPSHTRTSPGTVQVFLVVANGNCAAASRKFMLLVMLYVLGFNP